MSDCFFQDITVGALVHHLAFGLIPIGIDQFAIDPERTQEFVSTRHIEGMRCARAQRAEPEPVERHVQGDEAVLGYAQDEFLAKTGACRHAQREE